MFVAEIRDWTENRHVILSINKAKEKCINHIEAETGLLYDKPTNKGGNTNCGPIATKLFSPAIRQDICVLINNSEDRENYHYLLKMMNSFITIIEKYDNVLRDSKIVRKVGIDILLHIKNGFLNHKGESWVMIIPSVHQVCAHAGDLFDMNSGRAISLWSETPVESWNKYVRAYQSGVAARARQSSIRDNLKDVLTRMLIESHPKVASMKPRPFCSKCGEIGHTARAKIHSEQLLQSDPHNDNDEFIIKSMLLTSQ